MIIAISAGTSGGGGDDATPTASDKSTSGDKKETKKTDKAPTPIKVDAATLLKEFEGNEAAADAKYKGKFIQVTGIIEKIDTEIFDENDYVVEIADGGDFVFLTVSCLDQKQKDVVNLNKGDKITMIGKFKDGGDLGVQLNDCKAV